MASMPGSSVLRLLFTDFPVVWPPGSPPALNGSPKEFWEAITDANALLDAEPPGW
jgi:hypothetical protein